MLTLEIAVIIYIAYLIGSISSAIIVCRLMKLPDPRTQGSGNPGATNVLRLGGNVAAACVLLGDMLKGLLPVLLVKCYGFSPSIVACVAVAAFLGHIFPIFFRFEGGKGVATALGCLISLSPLAAVAWMVTWLIVAIGSRYSSLAALIATSLTPFYLWHFTHQPIYVGAFLGMTLLIIYRHRANIQRLILGTESKIGKKK